MNTDITAAENYRVVVHELGHFFICLHYKIASHIEIFSIDGGEHFDTNGDRSAGACFSEKFGTPFQDSVCSWAGLMAELIAGVQPPQFDTGFPMELKNLKYCHAIILSKYFKDLSLSDQLGICGKNSNDTLRSFKAAFRILSAEKSELLRLAELRTSRAAGRKATPSLPQPDEWPATHADFLRLICGNDETSFERFIVNKAQSHLAGGTLENFESAKQSQIKYFLGTVTDELRTRHSGKPDTEIAEVMFAENFASITNLQRTIYGSGFPDADSWLAAARAFKAWAKTAAVKNSTEQSHDETT